MSRDSRPVVKAKWDYEQYHGNRAARDAEYVALHGAEALAEKKAHDLEVLADLF